MNLPKDLMDQFRSRMEGIEAIEVEHLKKVATTDLIRDIIDVVESAMLCQELDRVEAHAAKIREWYKSVIATGGHADRS